MTELSLILHAPNGRRFAVGEYDDQIGNPVQVRKHLGGAYSGQLVAADVHPSGAYVSLKLVLNGDLS